MLRGFPATPAQVFTYSPHVRAFTLSGVGFCASSAAVLCLLEPAVVELFFVLLLSAPTCPGPCAVAWNTCTRHFCCSVVPLLLSVLVQTAPNTSSAASGRCSRKSPSRALVEGPCAPPSPFRRRLVRATPSIFLNVVPTCFPDVAVASLRLLQAHPFCREVLRTSLAHLAVGVSRTRHRLSVTFEMLALCCCPDVKSSSSWILSFAPSLAN